MRTTRLRPSPAGSYTLSAITRTLAGCTDVIHRAALARGLPTRRSPQAWLGGSTLIDIVGGKGAAAGVLGSHPKRRSTEAKRRGAKAWAESSSGKQRV